MINYLKPVIFKCKHSKYDPLDSWVRYWHIHKRGCYPAGCFSDQSTKPVPQLLITPEEYAEFVSGFNMFMHWSQSMTRKMKVSFLGVVHQVVPHFEISLVENTTFSTLKGYMLLYKECLIENTFFEDTVCVFIEKDAQKEFMFHDEDTVSGVGRFQIDQRGVVTISPAAKLNIILKGRTTTYWDNDKICKLQLRSVGLLYEDLCINCPHSVLTTSWNGWKKIHENMFCCTVGSCLANNETAKYDLLQLVDKGSVSSPSIPPQSEFPAEKRG